MTQLHHSLAAVTGTSRPLKVAVLSVIADLNFHYDKPGSELAGLVLESGHELADHACVHDDDTIICSQVQAWIDGGKVDVILTANISPQSSDSKSSDSGPPDIILVSDSDDVERASAAFHHPTLGCIGVVNLLTPLRRTG